MKKNEKLINENPMLKQETLQNYHQLLVHKDTMTVSSTLKKSLCALLVTLISAAYIWTTDITEYRSFLGTLIMLSIGAFVLAMIVSFKPLWAKYIIFPYAMCEGVLLGLFSLAANTMIPGIAFQAFLGTFIVFFMVAFISVNNIIKVTDSMHKRIGVMMMALFVLHSINLLLYMFGMPDNPFNNIVNGNGWMGILFSVFAIGLASFCLLADMDMIKKGAQSKMSKAIEWYCAFALLATVLWIYFEILRLLLKLSEKK